MKSTSTRCALLDELRTRNGNLNIAIGDFSQREALDALAPLMKANLAHLLQVGPQQALTGPVERGDTATVAKHLACLTGEDARQVYRGASRMLVELARNKHPDIDAESMNEILKEGSNR